MAEKNYFEQLYNIDVRNKVKTKNNLSYLSWASAWAEVKKIFPGAFFTIYEEGITTVENIGTEGNAKTITKTTKRPWFDDGNTGWVRTGVTIDGVEHIEELPIMDFKNKSIEASKITSADANKSIQRSLTKACARHGLGLYIYEGEDLPEEAKETASIVAEIMDLIKKKCALSDETKEKVANTCKEVLPEECNGDPKLCEDLDTLKTLKTKLMAIRVAKSAKTSAKKEK